MKSVVYGIVDARRAAREVLPTGLNDAKIAAIEHGRLAALLSPLSEELANAAGVDQALAYAKVVERLHVQMTIVPMRYGCFVQRPDDAVEFLRRHESAFWDALAILDGCDEMGLRILLPGSRTIGFRAGAEPREDLSEKAQGAAYLSSRRKFYEEQGREEQVCREWAKRIQAAFTGLYRHSSWEYVVRPEGNLLSLSFLVKKTKVPAFKERFRGMQQEFSVKAICSGPWPPYVFVTGLAKPGTAIEAEMDFLQRQKG